MTSPVGRAVAGIRFDHIVGVNFDFEPSIGIVAKSLDKLGLELEDYREPLILAIQEVMIPSFGDNFDAGGRPDAWEPLSPYTVKLRGGSAEPILVRSGRLKEAATSFDIWSVGAKTAVIRSLPGDVWYGVLQQGGYGGFDQHIRRARAKLGRGAKEADVRRLAQKMSDANAGKGQTVNIPARPFILIQEEDKDKIREIFAQWLDVKIDEAGW